MNIRPATAADASAIAAIWNPLILGTEVTFNSAARSEDALVELIAARPCFLVAEEGGLLLGFASYSQFRGGVGYARTMEHTVILADGARGKGVGRALMTALEAHARDGGVHSMIAGISSGNAPGLRFHAALGYEPVGIVREAGFKFERFLDLHLMQKRL